MLPPRQFLGYVQLLRQCPVVRLLRQPHQLVHLPLQLPLQRLGVLPTQCLVFAGVRLDLRTVQTHRPQLLGNDQDRQEQPLQFLQEKRLRNVLMLS